MFTHRRSTRHPKLVIRFIYMMNVQDLSLGLSLSLRGRSFVSSKGAKVQCLLSSSSSGCCSAAARCSIHRRHTIRRRLAAITTRAAGDDRSGGGESESSSSGGDDEEAEDETRPSSLSREDLERLVGPDDDDKFNGLDLANLIRKKYGRSYDVTLIKKVLCLRAYIHTSVASI